MPSPQTDAPPKPIGGFFGLEPQRTPTAGGADFGGPHTLAFWNARSALAHLLATLAVRRVWLPAYICVEVATAAALDGREVRFYPVGAELIPDGEVLTRGLRAGDAVLGVEYFGARSQVLPDLIPSFPDVTWIQDRAQAPWPDPQAWGDHVLYSPRKVIGAGDGGLLVSRDAIALPAWAPDPDQSRLDAARMRTDDPLGVLNDIWFPAYQAAEAAMTCEPRPMSNAARAVIQTFDVAAAIEARRRNAGVLLERVGEGALFTADRLMAGAPFGVPVLTTGASDVAAKMAQARVFCARHWAELPSPQSDFPAEHDLARRLLTLPCDHRYDADDMARVADAFLACR